MSENHVKFYFAYNSPYAFLANTRIEKELVEPLGATIEYKPVYQPRTGSGGPDRSSPRMKYIFEDVARFAEAYGLEINMGPLPDTGKACRGLLFAEGAGKGKPYQDRIFQARWLEGKDIGDDQTLIAIADEASDLGFTPDPVVKNGYQYGDYQAVQEQTYPSNKVTIEFN